MTIFKKYYNQTIKLDLINKYNYCSSKNIPRLKKIVLNLGCKSTELFDISSALLFLELISQKKGMVTKSKRGNVFLKIRKGNVVGCTVTLTQTKMYNFLFKLLTNVFPNFKNFNGIKVVKKNFEEKSFSFTIKDLTCFKELEKQFYFFPKLPPLNITFITNTNSKKETIYLLQAFKIPLLFAKK